jgi:hypothetical protein
MLLADVERQRLVLIGGQNGQPLADMWTYDLRERKWNPATVQLPGAIGLVGTARHVVGNLAYLYGGTAATGEMGDTLLVLDLRNLTVTAMTGAPNDLSPGGRWGASLDMDAVDNVLYLYGGRDANGRWLNDIWAYDLHRQTWSQVAPTCDPSPECPPPAMGSSLIASGTPGALTLAIGTPMAEWVGEHEWRYLLRGQRWVGEIEHRNASAQQQPRPRPPRWCSTVAAAPTNDAPWFQLVLILPAIFALLLIRRRWQR